MVRILLLFLSFYRYLINNIEELTNGKPNLRILVPFCGKTLDMIWLVEQGHTVIGVEVVQKAIQDFFSENDIPFEKEIINMAPNGANVYTAFNGKLKIFDCDYFSFNSSVAGGKVDGIWDCNAFGAIPPERRKEYMKASLNLLQRSPNGCILHKAFVYETDGTFTGPPHSITLDVLRALFDDSFEVRAVSRETQPEELHQRFGVSSLDVLVTSIKYKS